MTNATQKAQILAPPKKKKSIIYLCIQISDSTNAKAKNFINTKNNMQPNITASKQLTMQ